MGQKRFQAEGVDVVLLSNGVKVNQMLFDLLEGVERYGSLRKATATMKISYSNAWSMLSSYEEAFGEPLVVCSGECWKGSVLSPKGLQVRDAYENMRKRCSGYFDEACRSIFC